MSPVGEEVSADDAARQVAALRKSRAAVVRLQKRIDRDHARLLAGIEKSMQRMEQKRETATAAEKPALTTWLRTLRSLSAKARRTVETQHRAYELGLEALDADLAELTGG